MASVRIGVQIQPQHATYAQQRDAWLRAEEMGVDVVFNRWHALLRPDGRLRMIVPDIEFHALQLLGGARSSFPDQQQHAFAGFWGWRVEARGGSREDAHRWGYTMSTLCAHLTAAGFIEVERQRAGDDTEPWHLHVTARKP